MIGWYVTSLLEDVPEPGHPPLALPGAEGILGHRRADRPRLDGEDLDSVLGDLGGDDLGEADQGRLARDIRPEIGDGECPGPAGDVDDPTASTGNHPRQDGPGAEHRPLEVDLQAPPP